MKVLLVNGSCHEKGCTYTALAEVAKALNANGVETEIYQLGGKKISGCNGCWACKKIKKCVVEDGVNEFVERRRSSTVSYSVRPCTTRPRREISSALWTEYFTAAANFWRTSLLRRW